MKTLLTALLCAAMMFAAETAKVAPKPEPAKLTEVQTLKLEIVQLKGELLKAQASILQLQQQAINGDHNAVVREACEAAKIDVKDCSIDPRSGEVTKKPVEKPVEKKP